MAARQKLRACALVAGFVVVTNFFAGVSRSVDAPLSNTPPPDLQGVGIVCTLNDPFAQAASAATLPWTSVWYGHFSGGRPYSDGTGRTLIDWRDDHVCFATRSQCNAWIEAMRQSFSQPEGDWTCLFLR
jgi:hypothetical protein